MEVFIFFIYYLIFFISVILTRGLRQTGGGQITLKYRGRRERGLIIRFPSAAMFHPAEHGQ